MAAAGRLATAAAAVSADAGGGWPSLATLEEAETLMRERGSNMERARWRYRGWRAALGAGGAVMAAAGAAWPRGPGAPAAPVKVIFDTDMASDVDDVGALALLHALADPGEAEILAVGIAASRNENGARPCLDAINTWYGRPGHTDRLSARVRYPADRRHRAVRGGGGEGVSASAPAEQRCPGRRVHSIAGCWPRSRTQASSSSPSASSPTSSLLARARRDQRLDGEELVRRKVRHWACMGGRFPASVESGEFNLATYPEATAYVLAHWPTPVMFSGFEIGARVKTGAR